MIMKDRLLAVLPAHRDCFTRIMSSFLYIRDMKPINGGNATIDGQQNTGVAAVELYNPLATLYHIDFDGFPDNALPLSNGLYESQCECVLFPENCDQQEWVLFIETKYTDNVATAQNPHYQYPQTMVKQIKKTVGYFRSKGILAEEKIVYAIISFPTLMDAFDSWTFPIRYSDGTTETIEDILRNDRIHIRATNYALLKNQKRILLGQKWRVANKSGE